LMLSTSLYENERGATCYRFGAKQIFVTAPENVYRGATEGVKICTETQRTRRG
jgi:hypothetical protein